MMFFCLFIYLVNRTVRMLFLSVLPVSLKVKEKQASSCLKHLKGFLLKRWILLLEFYISLSSVGPDLKEMKAAPIDFSESP